MALLHSERLKGVKEQLVAVVQRAAELATFDITVSEGLRTKGKQQQLFEAGRSKTLNSKHLVGEAVDLYVIRNGKIDWSAFEELNDVMQHAADELEVNITWGGSWKKFIDKPHFELKTTI